MCKLPNRSYFNGSGMTTDSANRCLNRCRTAPNSRAPSPLRQNRCQNRCVFGSGMTFSKRNQDSPRADFGFHINRRSRSFCSLSRFRSFSLSYSSQLVRTQTNFTSIFTHQRFKDEEEDFNIEDLKNSLKLFNRFYLLYLLSFYFHHV